MSDPVSLSPAQQRILDAVASGLDARQAAAAAGVAPDHLYRWKAIASGAETWPNGVAVTPRTRAGVIAFVEALARAEAEGFQRLVDRLQHNANTPNPKTGWYDTQAIDKLLSKSSFRKWWYEREPEQDPARVLAPAYLEAQALTTDELEQSLQAADAADGSAPGGAGRSLPGG